MRRKKRKARKRRRLLRASACGMKKRRRWLGPNHYEIRIPDYSTSGHHRKRFGDQGKPEHAGLPGCAGGDEDGSEAGVQTIFKVKVLSVRTAMYPGKERRRESLPATVRTGKRRMYGCGPARRCRSTRRICRKQSALSIQHSAKRRVWKLRANG